MMTLNLFKLTLAALLVFVTCCRGVSFNTGADFTAQLTAAVQAANEGPIRQGGKLVASDLWIKGSNLEHVMPNVLREQNRNFAVLARLERLDKHGGKVREVYSVYGTPVTVRMPGHESEIQRIFIFGMGNKHGYAPFGFAWYETSSLPHAHLDFIRHAGGLDIKKKWNDI